MDTLTQPQGIKTKLGVLFFNSTSTAGTKHMNAKFCCRGFGFAADTQKQNLAHPLPPSQQKGDRRMGRAPALPLVLQHPRQNVQLTQQTFQSRTALKPGMEAQLASPANTSVLKDPQLFSASPEIPPGTSQVSCCLVPVLHAIPACPQLHASISGSAVKPRTISNC